MSKARDYLLAFENDRVAAQQIAQATADGKAPSLVQTVPRLTTEAGLQTQQTTLISVVQSLGEYINDEDDKIRSRAVSYLTAVISALPPQYLSRQQIHVLCQFLCDRIEDGGALEGLSRLQSLDRFTGEMVQIVVRA